MVGLLCKLSKLLGTEVHVSVNYLQLVTSFRKSFLGMFSTALIFNAIAPDNILFSIPWYWHFVLGGFVFGVVFVATDPVAGPMTDPGRWGFGLLVGALTVLIRVGNPSHYEGVMFAILLASMFSPLIDYVVTELNIRRRKIRLLGVSDE